jgi:hypothetical protein
MQAGESLDFLETGESLGKFKRFFNRLSAFLDQAWPLKEAGGNCFHVADLRRMQGISPYENPVWKTVSIIVP